VVPTTPTEAAAKAAWLAKLNSPAWGPAGAAVSYSQAAAGAASAFLHAPISYFGLGNLAAKGTRRAQGGLVDIGEPEDFSRPLKECAEIDGMCGARVGSWACTEGGWDSPKLRPTTETFLVLEGEGCVTDADGVPHPFGAGDVVVLPKEWNGRWDITRQIHKVWVVHDHADMHPGGVVRAVVAPTPSFEAPTAPLVIGGLHEAPANVAQTIYDLLPTRVGFVSCSAGSFDVAARSAAEVFFVVDGVFFLTNLDGSARRCTAGDTVVLPKGWSGRWDIIEPVRKVWVEVGE